ncbi:DUF5719 family protein [Microcella indica]|uniref:DUF5719 family protein n=1 Tax=Microcella indica TaxID=2750620 RepID=UPI0015CF51FA|nr:DUF5719 family protein [Microcella indica]
MTVTQRILAATGRAGLALAGAAAAVALGAVVLFAPVRDLALDTAGLAVTPDRSAQTVVCTGGVLGLTRGDDPQLTVAQQPQRRSVGTGLVESTVPASDALESAAVAVTLPVDAPDTAVAAAESTRVATADLRGLAAAECGRAERTAWLVGGSTQVGRTTWIVLTNPGEVDATVDLRVWGERGLLEAPGTSGIIVAAGTQRILPLAGIAVDEASPVIAVDSSGGSIAAHLQQSVVRGLDPSGVALVTPLERPSTSHVIPALPVVGSQLALEQATGDGIGDALTTLRMLVPGDTDSDVTVTLRPADGGTGQVITTTVGAGAVLDLPLTDLPDGDWAVVVDATEPLVVAGRTTTGGASGLDIAWFVPTGALEAGQEVLTSIAPTPGGVSARLHLYAPDGDVTATVDRREVLVPAGQSVVLETAANVGVRLAADGVLHASVSYRGDGLMAGTRILAPPLAAQPVTVYP